MDNKDDLFSADLFGEETEQVTEVEVVEPAVETPVEATVASEVVEAVADVEEVQGTESAESQLQPAVFRKHAAQPQKQQGGEKIPLVHFGAEEQLGGHQHRSGVHPRVPQNTGVHR